MVDATVITCTVNRPDALPRTLASFSEAIRNAPGMVVEVIVVDNGSRDNTQDVLQAWAKTAAFPVQIVHEKLRGVGHARNAGMKAAKGRLLVFTDDDCSLNPDYFTVLKRYYDKDTGPVMRGGRVELGDSRDLPFTIKLDTTPARMTDVDHPGTVIIGCNMVITREIMDKVGYFDGRFGAGTPFKAGEEADLIYRIYHAGFPVEYVPDLIVKHFHGRRDQADIARLNAGYSISGGAFYAKYITHWRLFRHFYWDVRKAAKEAFGGPVFNKDVGLTYRGSVWGNIKGMALYWKVALSDYLRSL